MHETAASKENMEAISELIKILEKSYCVFNPQYKEVLLSSIKRKTGNDNLAILCSYIIDNLIEN